MKNKLLNNLLKNRSGRLPSGNAKAVTTTAIPKVEDKTLQTWIKSIDSSLKEIAKLSLSKSDLVNAGLAKLDNGDLISLIPKEEEVDLTVPKAVLNLNAGGAYSTITLSWETPKSKLFGMNLVYRSEVDDFGTAVQVGSTAGDVYTDYIGNNQKVYYWVRTVSKFGVEGDLAPSVYAATSIDIEYVLDNLNGKIDDSALDKELREKIDNTVGNLLLEEQNRILADAKEKQDRALDMANEAKARALAIAEEAEARARAIAQEGQERALAIARESKLISDRISQETHDLVIQLESQSDILTQNTLDRVNFLKNEIQASLDGLNDGITKETQQRVDGDNAVTSELNAYKNSNNSAVATVLTKAESAITANSALSKRIDALVASLTEGDGTTIDVNAFNALRAEVSAIEGTTSSLVEDVTALETNYNNVLAAISSHGTAINTLQTSMTDAQGKISQLSSDTTVLKSGMAAVQDDLTKKVNSDAFNDLRTIVTSNGNDQEALSSDMTRLKASFTAQTAGDAITGTVDAISSLKILTNNPAKISLIDEPTATTGKVIRMGDNNGNDYVSGLSETYIPIRADRLYRFKYRFRRMAGTSRVYLGLMCANADKTKGVTYSNGVVPIESISNAIYVVSNANPTTSAWVEGEFYLKGRSEGASSGLGTKESPRTYPALASYARLCILSGYTTGAGQYDFDYLIYEDAEHVALNEAQANALANTQAQVTNIDGRTTSNTNSIISLDGRIATNEGAISKKAEASALNNYFTKTEADQATAGKISEFNAGLSIGGQNFWQFHNIGSSDYGSRTVERVDDNLQHQRITITGTRAGIFSNLWQGVKVTNSPPLNPETPVSASFSILSPLPKIRVYFYVWGQANNVIEQLVEVIPNQWHRVTVENIKSRYVDTSNPSANYLGLLGVRYRPADNNIQETELIGKVFEVRDLQCQEGSKATAYRKPDATIQNSLDATAKSIETTNTNVSNIDGRVTANTSAISSQESRLKTAEGAISKKAEASVLSNYYTKTEAESSTAGAIQKFDATLNIGGKNLFSYLDWNAQAKTTSYSSVPLATLQLLPNTKYTLSTNIAKSAGNFDVFIMNVGIPPNSTTNGVAIDLPRTITTDATGIVNIGVRANVLDSSHNKWIQVERGEVATAFTPNQKDSLNNVVGATEANANAIQNTNTNVSNVDGRVTANTNTLNSQGSRIAIAEGAISKKAEASALNNYYTKTEANQATAGQITEFNSSLKIGGTNLLASGQLQPTGFSTTKERIRSTWASVLIRAQDLPNILKTNTQYVFSYDVELLEAQDLALWNMTHNTIGFLMYRSGDTSKYRYFYAPELVKAGDKARVEIVFTTPDDFNGVSIIEYTQRFTSKANVNIPAYSKVKFSNIMIEEGNKATSWSPHPDDFQSQLDTNANAIQNTNTNVSNIDGRVTANTNTLNSQCE